MENDDNSKKKKTAAKKSERTIVARELFPPEFCHFGSITPLSSTDEGNPVIPRIPLLPDTIMVRKRPVSSEEQENVPRKTSVKRGPRTREFIISPTTETCLDRSSDEAKKEAARPRPSYKIIQSSRRTSMRAPSVAFSSQPADTVEEPELDSKSYTALASSYAALATATLAETAAIMPHFLSSLSTDSDAPIAAETRESEPEQTGVSSGTTQDAQASPTEPTVAKTTATETQGEEEKCVKRDDEE